MILFALHDHYRTMRTSRPRKPKRQKATQSLRGEAEESESEDGEEDLKPLMSGEATSEKRIGCSIVFLLNVWLFRTTELTDDILHIIFSYLQLKDRIRVERGIKHE